MESFTALFSLKSSRILAWEIGSLTKFLCCLRAVARNEIPQTIERIPATDEEKRKAVHLLAQILREGQRSGILSGARHSEKNREKRICRTLKVPGAIDGSVVKDAAFPESS